MKNKITYSSFILFIVFSLFISGFTVVRAQEPQAPSTEQVEETTKEESTDQESSTEQSTPVDNTTPSIEKSMEQVAPASSTIEVNISGISFAANGNSSEIGETLDVLSGSQILVRTIFSATSSATIAPGQLMFRAELPSNSGFVVAPSDVLDFKSGGPNGPDDTTRVDGKEYIWIIYKQEMYSGVGKSFSFYFNPFSNGVTANGTIVPINIQAYDGVTLEQVGNATTNNVISSAPVFSWKNVNASIVSGASFNSQGASSIPDVRVLYSTDPNYVANNLELFTLNRFHFQISTMYL